MRAASSALLLAVLVVAASAAGVAHAGDDTLNFRIDARHSGSAPDSPVQPPLRMRWRADLGFPVSNVIVTGGRAFYVRNPGTGLKLTALDVTNGAQLWSQDALPATSLAFDQGRLYVVSDGPQPHGDTGVRARALDPNTGNQLWSKDFSESYGLGGAPVAADGQLFFVGSSGGSRLYAVRGSDGGELWAPKSLQHGDSTPALDAETVYVSVPAHNTYAFDRDTGAQRWHSSGCCTGGGGWHVAVDSGRVYGYDGLVHNASDGTIVGETSVLPVFMGDGGVQAASASSSSGSSTPALRRFGPDLGTTKWQVAVEDTDTTQPLLAGQFVYLGGSSYSSSARLRVLRYSDGGEAWCQNLEMPPGSSSSSSSSSSTRVAPLAAGNGVILVAVGYGLAAFESGGSPSSCPDTSRTTTTTTTSTPLARAPLPDLANAAAGPALTLTVRPAELTLGERVNVYGELLGVARPAGLTVALDVDPWPFDGRWVTGLKTRVLRDGTWGVSFAPRRNLRVRARLVRDARATTDAKDVFADHAYRARVLGRGGRRPRLRLSVRAGRGAAIRKRVVYAYVARGGEPWQLVAARKWARFTRRTATVTFTYPRGRLGRRDHWMVCTPEPTPDAFGKPTETERLCGARTLPRERI